MHQLTRQLVEHGLLERAGHAVRLGLGLFEIGQLVTQQCGLVDAARPHLVDLREATRNTIRLAVLEGVFAHPTRHSAGRSAAATSAPTTIG